MRQHDFGWIIAWGFLGLLALAPLVRGGQQAWVALTVTAGILTLVTAAILCTLWGRTVPIVWSRTDLALLLGVCWVWVSLHVPSAPPDALVSFLLLLGCVGVFWLARALAAADFALWLSWYLCALGGLIAGVGLLQLAGVLSHAWWDPSEFVAATFVNHNHFAAFLELTLPLGCALWLAGSLKGFRRFVVAVCCVAMAIGLILSRSRGAWLSLTMASAIGLGWLWVRHDQLRWNWRAVGTAAVAMAAVGFLVSQAPILSRGASLLDASNDASVQTRQAIWAGSVALAQERPVKGHGLGSFVFEFPRHRPDGLYRLTPYAFNEYVQGMAELGLVGLAIGAWAAFLVLRRAGRLIRGSRTRWKRAVGLGGLIGLGSVALHSVVDYPWHIPAVAFAFAAVAGLLTGIHYYTDPSPLQRLDPRRLSDQAAVRRLAIPVILAGLVVLGTTLATHIVADLSAAEAATQRDAGNLAEAVTSFRRAIRHAPGHAAYHRQLGEQLIELAWTHQGLKRRALLKEAAAAFQQALALVPRDGRSADALGETLKALGEPDAADRAFARAVEADPKNPLYWKHWADLHLSRGKAPEAFEAYQRAAGLANPHGFFPSVFASLDDPDHFVQVGESAWLLGRLTVARTAFTIATSFHPTPLDAQAGLALCALSEGDLPAARQRMASVHERIPRAKWYAGLAQHHLTRGEEAPAEAALTTGLKLDPSNLLARHLELVAARKHQDEPRYAQAVERLLSLNRPPVFVRKGSGREVSVVWEPEGGTYPQGERTQTGWALFDTGSIHQRLVVPPGRVRFRLKAQGGETAAGLPPTSVLSWNGRQVFATAMGGRWSVYDFETDVRPGESLLTFDFIADPTKPLARSGRKVKVDHVAVSWTPL
ncbi:MAG: tetratricopeptide repeat protein [Candidatus Omnitrophica bacterium]|nr:tetratricopeptide repeat protein [Candidatus Omnitrophota bacterium]